MTLIERTNKLQQELKQTGYTDEQRNLLRLQVGYNAMLDNENHALAALNRVIDKYFGVKSTM